MTNKFIDQGEFLASLPHKRMGAGTLLLNENGELLMVKPNYKDHWSIPGGISDANESPRETAIRETEEEVGLKITEIKLVACTYIKQQKYNDESVVFLFYGGKLTAKQVNQIVIQDEELEEIKFVPIKDVEKYNKRLGKKLKKTDLEKIRETQYFEEYK